MTASRDNSRHVSVPEQSRLRGRRACVAPVAARRGPDSGRGRSPELRSLVAGLARGLVLALALLRTVAVAEPAQAPLPSFAELEAAGARIGKIQIVVREIFDTEDPEEDKLLFRWANALHIQTHPGVIERSLLFKTGDPVSVRVIEETERVLRGNRYLYDVAMKPVAYRDGVVDVEVTTRDSWTLDLGLSAGRSGGANTSGLRISDYNILGTGITVSFGRSNDVDRSSNQFQFINQRAFGGWTTLSYTHVASSDGGRDAFAVVRPFYERDARWAAGIAASKDDRIEAVYNAGEVASEYRHWQDRGEVFGGWSRGLIDGWVRRYSVGLNYQDDAYAPEPGRVAPGELPADEKLVGPFVRFQLIEDLYRKEQNRNQIGRPEYFDLGLASTVQLGWASTALGSSLDALLYSATISRGFEPAPEQTLIASGAISGQLVDGRVRRQYLGGRAQYYAPQGRRWLFYAAASGDVLTEPGPLDELLLGGENGLRGYPLRYQSGTRRALFTVEERFYTDLYIWRLFRIGGAGFYDLGRAWGGDNVNAANPGWLGNVGAGLRIVSARAAFSTVVHLDIAVPLNATADMDKVQFLVTTKGSF